MPDEKKTCDDCGEAAVLTIDRDEHDIFLCRGCAVKLLNALGEAVRAFDANDGIEEYQCKHDRIVERGMGLMRRRVCVRCGYVIR